MKPDALSTPAALARALLEHYDRHRRRLPWRGEADAYRILVSEVMLQQTRVETVRQYYGRWLERFPDLEALAEAEPDDVLKAWEGLGYYRRARNLHRTARITRERSNGSLPSSYAGLRELPGIGEYTAGAVASIAFGEAVPAVDGNVRRVLARLFDVAEPRPAWLRRTARSLLSEDRPGDWNQALMELGATVCLPRGPRCADCPVSRWCAARHAGTELERPAASARAAVGHVVFALAILHDRGRVLLVRRPEDGLLGGMWALPEREVRDQVSAEAAAVQAVEALGARLAGPAHPLPPCSHRFTHLRATYLPFALPGTTADTPTGVSWVSLSAPAAVAIPVAQQRVLRTFRESCVPASERGRSPVLGT